MTEKTIQSFLFNIYKKQYKKIIKNLNHKQIRSQRNQYWQDQRITPLTDVILNTINKQNKAHFINPIDQIDLQNENFQIIKNKKQAETKLNIWNTNSQKMLQKLIKQQNWKKAPIPTQISILLYELAETGDEYVQSQISKQYLNELTLYQKEKLLYKIIKDINWNQIIKYMINKKYIKLI